jgi:hypothetical protein
MRVFNFETLSEEFKVRLPEKDEEEEDRFKRAKVIRKDDFIEWFRMKWPNLEVRLAYLNTVQGGLTSNEVEEWHKYIENKYKV